MEKESTIQNEIGFVGMKINLEALDVYDKDLKKLVDEHMRKGKHFGTIGNFPKPTLFKPGAEFLCKAFNFYPEIETDINYSQDDCIIFYSKCVLKDHEDGGVVAIAGGNANTYEPRYKKNAMGMLNTVQKMAEKRAFVAAVLFATGASLYFTQDVEDMNGFGKSNPEPKTRQVKTEVNGNANDNEIQDMIKDIQDNYPPSDMRGNFFTAINELGKGKTDKGKIVNIYQEIINNKKLLDAKEPTPF